MNDTREKLIREGIAAVQAKSFAGVGINSILCAAGVPKGSFYHHFKSKEEFGVTLVEHVAREHLANSRAVLADEEIPSPLARLRRLFEVARERHAEAGYQHHCLIPKMALEQAQLSPGIRAAVQASLEGWRDMIAEGITAAQGAGEVRASLDALRTAEVICDAWRGAVVRVQLRRNLEPIDDFLDVIFERLLPP